MIGEHYPGARARLEAARGARKRMTEVWSGFLADGLFDLSVSTDDDGSGNVVAVALWPADARSTLTGHLQSCIDELWATLDSLVTEALSMYSAVRRVRLPENPRFFPMTDSAEGLHDLLQENCLDGIPNALASFVIQCQPFWEGDETAGVLRLRAGLKMLSSWTDLLHDGVQVGAWATPGEPEFFVEEPLSVASVETSVPGDLEPDKELARYRLSGYTPGTFFSVNPNSFIDISFAGTVGNHDGPKSFAECLDDVIRTVAAFIAAFEQVTAELPVMQGISQSAGTPRTWIEAGRSARAWTEQELADLAQTDSGIGIASGDGMSTLLVRTDQGVFERTIPAATELSPYAPRGYAAERAARNAVVTWGLPDFVLSPTTERKGRGVREISDGLIVVGNRGLVTQVKSRDTAPGTPEQEASWLTKKIAKAAGQVGGTARRLTTIATTMTNGRGRPIDLNGSTITWTGVVIIDHPAPPNDYEISAPIQRIPTVVLLRRDWEFLFQQLRSTHAVLGYLARIETSTTHLGGEPARYYELAADDAAATPGPPVPHLGPAGIQMSVPLLPTAPAGNDDDEAHGIVRIICEDIAHSPLNDRPENDRLTILAAIDSLPVGYRTDLGHHLLDGLAEMRNVSDEVVAWRSRIFRSADGPQLGFAVCSKHNETTSDHFRLWMLLRHHELWQQTDTPDHLLSVGVLLTPRHDRRRDWDTTLLSVIGDPGLTTDELGYARQTFNQPER